MVPGARRSPPRAHVHPGTPAAEAFAEAGWSTYEPTLLMLGSVSRVLRRLGRPAGVESGTPRPSTTAGWPATACGALRGSGAAVLEAGEVTFATVRDESGAVLARGRGAFHGDWVGVSSLSTREDRRGTGLGTAVLRHCWSGVPNAARRRRTCRWSWPNTAAQELYQGTATTCTIVTTTWSLTSAPDLRTVHLRDPDPVAGDRQPWLVRRRVVVRGVEDEEPPHRHARADLGEHRPQRQLGSQGVPGPAPSISGTATPRIPSVANRSRNSFSRPV